MLISIAYTKLMHKDKPHFLQRPKNKERISCEEVERKYLPSMKRKPGGETDEEKVTEIYVSREDCLI